MAAYQVPEHIWRTKDGRLVLTGDPDAAFLAYARGDEMSEDEAKRRGILDAVADKKTARDATPKAAVKPGLTINKASKETNNG
jgi:hypothetical protein